MSTSSLPMGVTSQVQAAYDQLRRTLGYDDTLTLYRTGRATSYESIGEFTSGWYAEHDNNEQTGDHVLRIYICDTETMSTIVGKMVIAVGLNRKIHLTKVGPKPVGAPNVWVVDVQPTGENQPA